MPGKLTPLHYHDYDMNDIFIDTVDYPPAPSDLARTDSESRVALRLRTLAEINQRKKQTCLANMRCWLQALKACPVRQALMLETMTLDTEFVAALVEYMRDNPHLEQIYLHGSYMSSLAGVVRFMQALKLSRVAVLTVDALRGPSPHHMAVVVLCLLQMAPRLPHLRALRMLGPALEKPGGVWGHQLLGLGWWPLRWVRPDKVLATLLQNCPKLELLQIPTLNPCDPMPMMAATIVSHQAIRVLDLGTWPRLLQRSEVVDFDEYKKFRKNCELDYDGLRKFSSDAQESHRINQYIQYCSQYDSNLRHVANILKKIKKIPLSLWPQVMQFLIKNYKPQVLAAPKLR